MHLRRAVLLMALIFMVIAIVGALVPVPRERVARVAPRPAPLPHPAPGAPVRTLSLRFPAPSAPPRLRVEGDSHVVLQVATSEPGQATVDPLGLIAPAEPDTPARFDLLATRPGSYPVEFEPAAGGPARTVGTLTVAVAE
jgi:hypothetical protein